MGPYMSSNFMKMYCQEFIFVRLDSLKELSKDLLSPVNPTERHMQSLQLFGILQFKPYVSQLTIADINLCFEQ